MIFSIATLLSCCQVIKFRKKRQNEITLITEPQFVATHSATNSNTQHSYSSYRPLVSREKEAGPRDYRPHRRKRQNEIMTSEPQFVATHRAATNSNTQDQSSYRHRATATIMRLSSTTSDYNSGDDLLCASKSDTNEKKFTL